MTGLVRRGCARRYDRQVLVAMVKVGLEIGLIYLINGIIVLTGGRISMAKINSQALPSHCEAIQLGFINPNFNRIVYSKTKANSSFNSVV